MENRYLPARIAGIAGLVFVLCVAVPGFASGNPPDPADPASKFLTYYHDNRGALVVAQLLGTVGALFAVFFFGKLISALRRADGGETGALTIAAMISITMVATLATAGGVLQATAAFRLAGSEHIDPVTLEAFNDASLITFALLGIPFAAFFASIGMQMRATELVPAWMASLTFVIAGLEVLGSCTVVSTTGFYSPGGPAGLLFGLIPFGIFALVTSIYMLVRPAVFDGAGASAASATAVGSVPAAAS